MTLHDEQMLEQMCSLLGKAARNTLVTYHVEPRTIMVTISTDPDYAMCALKQLRETQGGDPLRWKLVKTVTRTTMEILNPSEDELREALERVMAKKQAEEEDER